MFRLPECGCRCAISGVAIRSLPLLLLWESRDVPRDLPRDVPLEGEVLRLDPGSLALVSDRDSGRGSEGASCGITLPGVSMRVGVSWPGYLRDDADERADPAGGKCSGDC